MKVVLSNVRSDQLPSSYHDRREKDRFVCPRHTGALFNAFWRSSLLLDSMLEISHTAGRAYY